MCPKKKKGPFEEQRLPKDNECYLCGKETEMSCNECGNTTCIKCLDPFFVCMECSDLEQFT